MTRDEAARVLNRLTAGYDKRLADDTLGIWHEELAELDFSAAHAAARDLVKTSKFMPSIAEFLAAYQTHRQRQAPYEPHQECRRCDGSGFTDTDRKRDEVIPCSSCRPTEFQRWADGFPPTERSSHISSPFVPKDKQERPTPAEVSTAYEHLAAIKASLPPDYRKRVPDGAETVGVAAGAGDGDTDGK